MTSTDFIAADELRALRRRVAQERMNYLVNLGKVIRHMVTAGLLSQVLARPTTMVN